jgi:rod shape-determining protein MreD
VVLDWGKAVVLVFVAAILQVSVFADVRVLHGTPDLLLVGIICVALLRGPVVGATVGFWGGLLVDVANLGTLGVTSLLLTLAGYWIGRYGETTGHDRTHAPFVSVAVITLLYAIGSLAFHYVLGDPAPARTVLWSTLFQGIALNLILAWPMHRVARLVLPPVVRRERTERIHALG